MDKVITSTKALVLMPSDPLLSDFRYKRALIHCLSERAEYIEIELFNREVNSPNTLYTAFLADKISPNVAIWDLKDNQRHHWLGTVFPSPIVATILPVIDPRKWFHEIKGESSRRTQADIEGSIARLIESQKTYLKSCTSPIRAYRNVPLLFIYIRDLEEEIPVEHLIGDDLLEVGRTFIYTLQEMKSFTGDLQKFLVSL